MKKIVMVLGLAVMLVALGCGGGKISRKVVRNASVGEEYFWATTTDSDLYRTNIQNVKIYLCPSCDGTYIDITSESDYIRFGSPDSGGPIVMYVRTPELKAHWECALKEAVAKYYLPRDVDVECPPK